MPYRKQYQNRILFHDFVAEVQVNVEYGLFYSNTILYHQSEAITRKR